MPEQLMNIESYKNGTILGAVLGATLLWGDKVREPLVKFLNSIMPKQVEFLGILWAPLIIILIGGMIGYIIDKN
jgi:hypothetical protein